MMIRRHAKWWLCWCGVLLAISFSSYAQDSTPQPQLRLLGNATVEDTATVTLQVQAIAEGRALTDLGTSDFAISEPINASLTINSNSDQSLNTVIVVDLSQGSDLAALQGVLYAYRDVVYQPDDTLILIPLRRGTDLADLIARPTSREELTSAIDSPSISNTFVGLDTGLETARAEIENLARPSQVLLVASYVNGAQAAQAVATTLAEMAVPVHVVQAHSANATFTRQLEAIAVASTGMFAENSPATRTVTLSDGRYEALGGLQTLFQRIQDNRTSYTVQFTSAVNDIAATRDGTLSLNAPFNAQVAYSYQPAYQAPTITFVNQTNFNPTRNFNEDGNLEERVIEIVLAVDFPDGIPRNVDSLQVQVENMETSQEQVLTASTRDEEGNYVFEWSLAPFTDAGQRADVAIEASLTDPLGLTATNTQAGSVSVAEFVVPPTNTPRPTNTPVPTAAPSSNIVDGAPPVVDVALSLGGFAAAAVFGLASAFLLLTSRGRQAVRRGTELVGDLGKTALDAVTGFYGEDSRPPEQEILAELRVSSGLNMPMIPITQPRFVIGRLLEAGCDFAIPKQSVSRRHIAFQLRGGRFYVEDLGSRFGTFVNGQLIEEGQTREIKTGDEINLANRIYMTFHSMMGVSFDPGNPGSWETPVDPDATRLEDDDLPPAPASASGRSQLQALPPQPPSSNPFLNAPGADISQTEVHTDLDLSAGPASSSSAGDNPFLNAPDAQYPPQYDRTELQADDDTINEDRPEDDLDEIDSDWEL